MIVQYVEVKAMSGIGGYGKPRTRKPCQEDEHRPASVQVRVKGEDWRAICEKCGRPIRNIGDEGKDLWVIDRAREVAS
jgi:hypothetical protein